MASYAGGTLVKSGYYIDGKSFAFVNIARDGEKLPGGPEARFVRVPVLVVMAAAPALGGLLVVALPFIGFGVAAQAIARGLARGARKGAREIAATLAPSLVPGEAHLAGKPAEKGAQGTAEDREAETLAKEIEERRAR